MGIFDKLMDTMHLGNDYEDDYDDYDDDFDDEPEPRGSLFKKKDKKYDYDLGDNEFHLAFRVDDFEAAHAKHKEMGCICFENEKMGIYFITDPDNYWLEIVPTRK